MVGNHQTSNKKWLFGVPGKSLLCHWQIQRSKLQSYHVLPKPSPARSAGPEGASHGWNFHEFSVPFSPSIRTPPRFTSQIFPIMFQLSTINYPMFWKNLPCLQRTSAKKVRSYHPICFFAPVAVRKSCCSCSLIPLRSWTFWSQSCGNGPMMVKVNI